MVLFESVSTTGSGVEIGFPQASHRLNITPPFYFCDLSKAGLRIIFCDKPRSSDGYANLIRILEEFCSHKLKAKKAKKYDVTAIVLSEIAHVSGEPMEPTHMLLKLVVAGEESIPKAVLAHIYLVGWVPKARYDTATVSWKETDDLAEHEIWAMREAQILRMDSIGEVIVE